MKPVMPHSTATDLPELREILAAAPPGSRITLVVIETPWPDPELKAPAEPQSSADLAPPTVASTPVDVVLAVTEALPPDEWGRQLPQIGRREIERAVKKKVLACVSRGFGRGHSAKVITPDEMLRYVRLCRDIQNGNEPCPTWWHQVRKGSNAALAA